MLTPSWFINVFYAAHYVLLVIIIDRLAAVISIIMIDGERFRATLHMYIQCIIL